MQLLPIYTICSESDNKRGKPLPYGCMKSTSAVQPRARDPRRKNGRLRYVKRSGTKKEGAVKKVSETVKACGTVSAGLLLW